MNGWIVFSVLAFAFLPDTAQAQTDPLRSAADPNNDAKRQVEDVPSIVRSVRDLNRLRAQKQMAPVPVELTVSMTFVGPSWTNFFAVDGADPIMIGCTSAVSRRLERLPLGTRLRIWGESVHGHEAIDMVGFEVLGGRDGVPVETPRSKFESGKLPANVFLAERGKVLEVFRSTDRTSFAVQTATEICNLDVFGPSTNEQVLTLLNQDIEFLGVFSPSFSQAGKTAYNVRLLSSSQINVVPPQSADTVPETAKPVLHRGEIVYSDGKSHFILSVGNDVLSYQSRFCEVLQNGCRVEVLGTPIAGDGSWQSVAVIIEGNNPPADAVPMTVGKLLSSNPHPVRVTLDAKVEKIEHDGNVLVIDVTSDSMPVRCRIPEYNFADCLTLDASSRAEDVGPGDLIQITGAVKTNGGNSNDSAVRAAGPIQLFSSSSRDLTIVKRARHFTLSQLISMLGGAALILTVSFGGNWYLKQAVDIRTKQLSTVSERLQASFESMKEGLVGVENDGRVVGVNRRFVELFGFEPQTGESLKSIFDRLESLVEEEIAITELRQHARSPSVAGTVQVLRLSGSNKTVEVAIQEVKNRSGTATGFLWSFEDISKRLEFENEVLELKKLDAAGQLSAGVAHDFNNLLSVIRSNLFSLEQAVGSNPRTDPMLTAADMAVERAAVLTQYLLDYSRRSRLELAVVDLRRVLRHVQVILRSVMPKSAELRVDFPGVPLPVNLDENRFEQVLINLCINARDALPAHGGEIQILADTRDSRSGNKEIVVRVIDNGHGMTRDIAARVFEPFFSTKGPGQGTGLGLAMAHGVVVQFGGSIRCESEPGRGTTFEIVLPTAMNSESDSISSLASEQSLNIRSETRKIRVLLVDDEPLVRTSGQSLMEALGYSAVLAANGIEALSILHSDSDFDVVLLDMTMPELSGQETFRRIRKSWPTLKVVLCSGFSQDAAALAKESGEQPGFLQKPYKISDLKRMLEHQDIVRSTSR